LFARNFFSRCEETGGERIYFEFSTNGRHVPSNSSYRAYCRIFPLIFLVLFSPVAFAKYETNKSTSLYEEPDASSKNLGLLPKATILEWKEEIKNGFAKVKVELEDEEPIEGWIKIDRVKPALPVEEIKKKKAKIFVPEDEGLLMRREASFLYGVQAGADYSIIQTSVGTDNYTGIGILGGGYVGAFLDKDFPIRFEFNFFQTTGTSSVDFINLGFNFFEVGIVPSYMLSNFEIFGGLSYAFGLGMADIPTGITVTGPSAQSSPGAQIGVGYHIPTSSPLEVAFRLKYSTLFNRGNFAFNIISLLIGLEFHG
jgi:hypothetical protein